MKITREMIVGDLAERCGYYKSSVRTLLLELDDLIRDYCAKVTDDDEIVIQMIEGIKFGCKIVPERERVDPRNLNPVVVKPTVKPFSKFSSQFRDVIQNNYDKKKGRGI